MKRMYASEREGTNRILLTGQVASGNFEYLRNDQEFSNAQMIKSSNTQMTKIDFKEDLIIMASQFILVLVIFLLSRFIKGKISVSTLGRCLTSSSILCKVAVISCSRFWLFKHGTLKVNAAIAIASSISYLLSFG